MSDSGIVTLSGAERTRLVALGTPWSEAVMVCTGRYAQEGCAVHVGVVEDGYINAQWAPRYACALPPYAPWAPSLIGPDWPQSNSETQTRGALRVEVRVGSVQHWWWADLRSGTYALPPCDEARVAAWVWQSWAETVDPLTPITVQVAMGASTQMWRPDPWTATLESEVSYPGAASAFAIWGRVESLPPYAKRWRPQLSIGESALSEAAPEFGLTMQTSSSQGALHPGAWIDAVDGPVTIRWNVPARTDSMRVRYGLVSEVGL